MARTIADTSRKFLLDITPDGMVTIRERGVGKNTGGLPFFSTDTAQQANQLCTLLCKNAWGGGYKLHPFGGELSDMDPAADLFRAAWEKLEK